MGGEEPDEEPTGEAEEEEEFAEEASEASGSAVEALNALGDEALLDTLAMVLIDRTSVLQGLIDWAVPTHAYVPAKVITDHRFEGSVKSYSDKERYGFIKCESMKEAFGNDVFVHAGQLGSYQVGDEVNFAVFLSKDHKPQAFDVTAGKAADYQQMKKRDSKPVGRSTVAAPTAAGARGKGGAGCSATPAKPSGKTGKAGKPEASNIPAAWAAQAAPGWPKGGPPCGGKGGYDAGYEMGMAAARAWANPWGGPPGNFAEPWAPPPAPMAGWKGGCPGMDGWAGGKGPDWGMPMYGGGAAPPPPPSSGPKPGTAARGPSTASAGGVKRGATERVAAAPRSQKPTKSPAPSKPAPASSTDMPGVTDQRFVGNLKSFSPKNGYGFIRSEDLSRQYGQDVEVFVHKAQVGNFNVGDDVDFKVILNKDNKPQALDLQQVGGGSTKRRKM